jgi:hypothetical protein
MVPAGWPPVLARQAVLARRWSCCGSTGARARLAAARSSAFFFCARRSLRVMIVSHLCISSGT